MAAAAIKANPSRQNTILLVEDEVLVRLMIADALRAQGFEVLEATTASEALTVLESRVSVDLVFTDVRLPGAMDGIALVRRLRETHPGLKLVVASGYTPQWPSPNLADAFVGKPYDVARVVTRLKALLEVSEQ